MVHVSHVRRPRCRFTPVNDVFPRNAQTRARSDPEEPILPSSRGLKQAAGSLITLTYHDRGFFSDADFLELIPRIADSCRFGLYLPAAAPRDGSSHTSSDLIDMTRLMSMTLPLDAQLGFRSLTVSCNKTFSRVTDK